MEDIRARLVQSRKLLTDGLLSQKAFDDIEKKLVDQITGGLIKTPDKENQADEGRDSPRQTKKRPRRIVDSEDEDEDEEETRKIDVTSEKKKRKENKRGLACDSSFHYTHPHSR